MIELFLGASAEPTGPLMNQAPAGLDHPVSVPCADFTAEDFLAWARTIPPEKEYDFTDVFGCALCHYFHDRGIGFRVVGGLTWTTPSYQARPIPDAIRPPLREKPRTYGALVERLEGALS